MNILIVVRCFPPNTGGGRSYRMSKLTKYLTGHGHNVVVLSSDEDIDPDNSMLKGVDKSLFFDVRAAYKPGKLIRLLTKITKQISVADGEVYLTYKLIDKLMKTQINMIPDVILTSSAPYEVHLIGMHIQKRYGIKWIADYRDPYTLNHNYKPILPIKRYFDRKLEDAVYKKADGVIFNTNINYEESQKVFELDKYDTKYTVCQNGYDEDDVSDLDNIDTGKTILSYVGGIRGDKQERYFIDQVVKSSSLLKEHNILVRFIGNGSHHFEDYGEKYHDVLQIIGFCEQDKLQKYWNETDWLILFLPESNQMLGWVPQKLYTYMSLNKPIIAAVPNGEAKNYLQELSGNIILEPNNYKLSDILPMLVRKQSINNSVNAKPYEQKHLYGSLVNWINDEIINA